MDTRILARLQDAITDGRPASTGTGARAFTSVIIGGGAFEMPDREEAEAIAVRRDIAFEEEAVRRDRTRQAGQDATIADNASASTEAEEAIALSDPKRFILAGRAIFTLQGKETRYTYRVNRSEPKEGSPYSAPAYFVSLLTGPDNTADYTYLGMLIPESGEVRLTRKSQYNDTSKPVQAVRWAFARIWTGRPIDPARIYHIGRCGRCGRALTVPSSIEAGIGPECAGKL